MGEEAHMDVQPPAQRKVVGSNPALPSTVVWDVSHGPFSVKAAVCKERLPFGDGLRLECRQGEEEKCTGDSYNPVRERAA